MYFYVFDSFLQDKKYQSDVIRIESRLGVLGITGRTEKLTILKNLTEATREALKRGAKTIVAVGNDQTVMKILPSVLKPNVVVGFIPVGPQGSLASLLGIPSGAAACDTISRRVTAKLDVGLIHQQLFLLSVDVPSDHSVQCDEQYSVSALDSNTTVRIMNLGASDFVGQADDQRLDVIAGGQKRSRWGKNESQPSVFRVKKVTIKPQDGAGVVMADGLWNVKTPATATVAPDQLEMIVGPDRRVAL